MKQLNILILIMILTHSCQFQKRIDLAEININDINMENLRSGIDIYKRDVGDIQWGYPNYRTYDMEKFRWGDYKFISNNDFMQNNVEIICDSTGSYPIIMLIEIFHEKAEHATKQILEQLKNQYGEPVTLHDMKLHGLQYTAYFWLNAKEDQSLLFYTTYFGHEPKPIDGMGIYLIKNETDIVGQDYDYYDMNTLEYLILQYSRWEKKERREVMQKVETEVKKPYYMIDFSAAACRFTILVNDMPVIDKEVKGQASTFISINSGILESGIQEIEIRILPLEGETEVAKEAGFNYKLYLFDVSKGDLDYQKELPGLSDIMTDERAIKTPSSVTFKDTFDAEMPYVLKRWKKGKLLTEYKTETIKTKLKDKYQEIATIINKKNYKNFEYMIADRERAIAVSAYLSENERKARVESIIYYLKVGFKVMPLPEDAILSIYGNGRTAVFKRPNGEPALLLYNKKTKEEMALDLMFYIPENEDEFDII